MRCERWQGFSASPERSRGAAKTGKPKGDDCSDDDRFAGDGLEFVAEADDTGFDLVGGAEVDDQQGIGAAQDDAVEQLQHFGVPSAAESALEDG